MTDISQRPYLKEVCLLRIEAEVGLLIGANNPKAIEPLQVINSEDEGPYAVKTALRWVIKGPLRKGDGLKSARGKVQSYSVNRISLVEVEELLVKQYNRDFPERSCEEKEGMSQEITDSCT